MGAAMKRDQWSLLTLLLPNFLIVLPTAGAVEPANYLPTGPASSLEANHAVDWPTDLPVMRALDPEEAQRQMEAPKEPERPPVVQHDAALPDPLTGRELVDRVFMQANQGQRISVQPATAKPLLRAFKRQHVAPTFGVPIPQGTAVGRM
jgi:hypothetical protein